MSKALLAVFNDSLDYVNLFMEFFRTNNSYFDCTGFTSLQALESYLSTCRIDILLLTRDSLEKSTTKYHDKEELLPHVVNSGNVKEIVYLGEKQDLSSAEKEINMYRPMSDIYADLIAISKKLDLSGASGTAVSVTGIYVLDGPYDPYALALSLAAHRTGPAPLYIDLDRFSSLPGRLNLDGSHTLTDLIYYFKTDSENFSQELKKCIFHGDDLCMISAPVSADDIDEIPPARWEDLLSEISLQCGHLPVIVSITDSCKDLISLFSICSEIYVFTDNFQSIAAALSGENNRSGNAVNTVSGWRTRAFSDYFIKRHRTDLLNKMTDAAQALRQFTQTAEAEQVPLKKNRFRFHG